MIRINSNAKENTKVCPLDLPVILRHIPHPRRTIKPHRQSRGKTTPIIVKIIESVCHCIVSKYKIMIKVIAVTAKILNAFLRSFFCCILARCRASVTTSAASSFVNSRLTLFSDFISSRTLMSKASASDSIVFISGNPIPLSQRLTALSVT